VADVRRVRRPRPAGLRHLTALYDPACHEPLQAADWDRARAREAIARIVEDTQGHFSPATWWPVHPRDIEPGDADVPSTTLYYGAAGVIWALEQLGAAPDADLGALVEANAEWLRANGFAEDRASYLLGDTPIELMAYGREPTAARADRLAALIAAHRDHPARELLWGAPGTMLAALFLHERDGDERWAGLFRDTAAELWSQLEYSEEYGCRYWTQDLYGERATYLGAAHGFAGVASPLIRGRALLGEEAWAAWQDAIAETVGRTAVRDGALVNWRASLFPRGGRRLILQWCHGSPGFVVCLGDLPPGELDEVLLAAGETTWAAGPLVKGPGLCHGTAGNGYAFLKLYRRTGDGVWLERARAFAMHAIGQMEREAARQGHVRHSLWTGDLGLAIYLRDCLEERSQFPTLDVFWPARDVPRSELARPRLCGP
jgi:Lanthionine synthetase C-like protein